MIYLLYYKHWTDKWKYIPYISVTHKVLKSCRSKMTTLEHNVCDKHGASSPLPHQIFILSHQKSIQPNKKDKKMSFLAADIEIPKILGEKEQ